MPDIEHLPVVEPTTDPREAARALVTEAETALKRLEGFHDNRDVDSAKAVARQASAALAQLKELIG